MYIHICIIRTKLGHILKLIKNRLTAILEYYTATSPNLLASFIIVTGFPSTNMAVDESLTEGADVDDCFILVDVTTT